jgi:type III restriction enzyme
MPDVVILNPVLNSPYEEPERHFVFDKDGITDQIAETRRLSSYFLPIPPAKKKGGQAVVQGDWLGERIETNDFVNRIRARMEAWRGMGRPGITAVTRSLLDRWRSEDRERRLFFCQVEAIETAIYLTEVADRNSDGWVHDTLRTANEGANPGLGRVAFKMATGSGKTVVMAMLIAWQALNKIANQQDRRFSDSFLIVTPGITIKDRLRVLLPNDPDTYYTEMDLLTADQLVQLMQARIVVTNFHTFLRRDKIEVASLTKKVLAGPEGNTDAFKETPGEMARRVCRELGSKRNLVVINDEAHHCYREKPGSEEEKLEADERAEAKTNTEAARVWISGLEAIRDKFGLRAVYDLSATPFFLRGSGYKEGTLFPWVVSDFSLIDAIEAGIVKVPRVPVADNQVASGGPTYRDLWPRISKDLPRKGRATAEAGGEPQLPIELEGALISLYGNYEKSFKAWAKAGQGTPPVFIVVCNNTNVSKLVFDWVGGWEKHLLHDVSALVPGKLELFSNVDHDTWSARPVTLLIDSVQLETGGGLDDNFKKAAAAEIERYKDEFRRRFPGRAAEELTDEDLLREVMNTVGKPGRLGEQIRCVVSVSMLTEGWDANTVTHILGVRAFGTQLLCEQVVGRGLRRASYTPNEEGRFDPEYAEVYGVPFSFIPTRGKIDPKPPKPVHRVQAQPERAALEISFPRVTGYRWQMPVETLRAEFGAGAQLSLSTQDVPTMVELDPIAGESAEHDLEQLRRRREQEVAFVLAKRTLDRFFRDSEGAERPWLFGDLLRITKEWLATCVTCKDNAFPQMLLISGLAMDASNKINQSITDGTTGEKRLVPILRAYEAVGSSSTVGFDTTKSVVPTEKSHVNYVTVDSGYEEKVAAVLESMDEVLCYVKNQGLDFVVPYTLEGVPSSYYPDFLVRLARSGRDPLMVIVEVSGPNLKAKREKAATARDLWVPAVNNHGGFGTWAFVEITDPWDAEHLLRAELQRLATGAMVEA